MVALQKGSDPKKGVGYRGGIFDLPPINCRNIPSPRGCLTLKVFLKRSVMQQSELLMGEQNFPYSVSLDLSQSAFVFFFLKLPSYHTELILQRSKDAK